MGLMTDNSDRELGPNAKKLLSRFIAREAVPPGGGLQDSLQFFTNAEHRHRVLEVAMEKLDASIALIRQAPDNPYGEDEDAIAAGILEELEKFEARRDGK